MKKEYAMFLSIINRENTKKRIYLRLVNSEKNNEDDEENFLA